MQSEVSSVEGYLESLPEDRREVLAAIRKLILKNLPKGYQETINWGMISYEVPLKDYPDTYNKQPLSYAALANQKNNMTLYLHSVYAIPALREKLEEGFKTAGKKLDCGKSCLRFRKLEDLPLPLIGELIKAMPMKDYIAHVRGIHSERKK